VRSDHTITQHAKFEVFCVQHNDGVPLRRWPWRQIEKRPQVNNRQDAAAHIDDAKHKRRSARQWSELFYVLHFPYTRRLYRVPLVREKKFHHAQSLFLRSHAHGALRKSASAVLQDLLFPFRRQHGCIPQAWRRFFSSNRGKAFLGAVSGGPLPVKMFRAHCLYPLTHVRDDLR
jgi:hypothetical protein